MPASSDLGNSANWEFLINESRAATVITPGQIVPIPKFSIPVLLDKPTIAVRVDSVSAPPTWRFAGDIFQEISLGIVVGGQPDAIASRRRVWLNQVCLFFLPSVSSTYALTYLPPKWFKNVTISVWEYIGTNPVSDGTDNAAVLAQLTEIENKINTLL